LILDFVTVYLFTGQIKMVIDYMIASPIYTTLAYFVRERMWDKIKWGKIN